METAMPEPLQQITTSLPPALIALVQRHAAQTDRTLGGTIRHIVAEWARSQPPPEGVFDFPTLPAVEATPEAIAAAKARVAAMRQEQARIRRKKTTHGTTVDEDAKADRFIDEIATMEQRIALAEKMMPRSRNGG
jgi:hypothetical protein